MTHTYPPADGDGWPGGSATTDRLLPCHLNKTQIIIRHYKQDLHEHTLCCYLLFCARAAGTDTSTCGSCSAQTLFQILLPGPSLLLTLVWGNVRNKCQKEPDRASREHHFLNVNLIKLLQGANVRCDLSSSSAAPSAPLESGVALQNLLLCPAEEINTQEH